jgi:hypothetical protein
MTAFQTDAAAIAIAFIRLTIANSDMRTGRCGVNYYESK